MEQLRTFISPELLRRRLLLGSSIATPGILLMVGAAFLPPQALMGWGVPIALLSLLLIAAGLIPYRRCTRLQLHPNTIELRDDHLTYVTGGVARFHLPRKTIAELSHWKEGDRYGVGVRLRTPLEEKIVVADPRFDMRRFLDRSERCGFDLLFPLFNERAASELSDWTRIVSDC